MFLRCVLGNTTILAEFVSEEEVSRYFAHSQGGGSGSGAASSVGQGPMGTGTPGAGGRGSPPGSERAAGGSGNGGGAGPPTSGWQGLDDTGSSPDAPSAQGPGMGIFTQWSSNGGAIGGAGVGVCVEAMEPGRAGLWGGMTPGYPGGSSLWGAPQMEDRHQMDSPAALLPGDLLGGGADSI